jgi:CheY-like chemotaxis protein
VPKILVADDNANIQKMVALSFEDRGVSVVSVGNGEAAVRRIPDLKPDLVLADIFMPVRNGYEVCEFVKKDERFSHVPVILLVGAFDPLDEKEARRVGADGVLKKPFVPPDPLIAMVMSALEKNPKVAAELAKAREAKEAPPPAVVESIPSIPEPATSARAELKPLPDFPEPTPEEAALVYGFGTGRRALDDAPLDAAIANEPKPPVAEPEQAEEDEFDGASTTRDWRRNAMEIDIPPEAANRPAFATDDESDSSMFPSERDVPPRRVPFSETVEETQAPGSIEASTPAEPAAAPIDELPSVSAPDSEFFAPTDPLPVSEAQLEHPAPQPATFEPEPAPAPEPVTRSGPSHWMDQLAQGSSDHPATDWMSVLSEQTVERITFAQPEPERETSHLAPAPSAEALSVSEVDVESSLSPAPEPMEIQQGTSEGSFFADEAAPTAPSVSWSSLAESVREEPKPETIEPTVEEPRPVVSSSRDEGFEPESASEPSFSSKDPELVEPPAVHVTPEPLLVEEEPQVPSQYGAVEESDMEPTHSFIVPNSAALAIEEPPREEPASVARLAPSPETEPAEVDVNERIPTGPPPNREVLQEIPFLNPPPTFLEQPAERASASPETVDAVVRKVLEKLEPQLHDLLSQGVLKPLVENLLQNELAKKQE